MYVNIYINVLPDSSDLTRLASTATEYTVSTQLAKELASAHVSSVTVDNTDIVVDTDECLLGVFCNPHLILSTSCQVLTVECTHIEDILAGKDERKRVASLTLSDGRYGQVCIYMYIYVCVNKYFYICLYLYLHMLKYLSYTYVYA
jgi:hypothetical protein